MTAKVYSLEEKRAQRNYPWIKEELAQSKLEVIKHEANLRHLDYIKGLCEKLDRMIERAKRE